MDLATLYLFIVYLNCVLPEESISGTMGAEHHLKGMTSSDFASQFNIYLIYGQ